MIPDLSVSSEEKEQMITSYYQGKNNIEYGVGESKHYLNIYEPKSGYLSYEGAYQGNVEITYWNKSDGTKLVACTQTACGPMCEQNISFYIYTEKNYPK